MDDAGDVTVERRSLALDVTLLCALAMVVRLVHIDFAPDVDEMNDLLAARSLIAHGAPLLDGIHPYTRARLFTYLVAGFMRLFGETLVVARLPSVLAGVALVALVYWWVRAMAGRWAGGIAALLLAVSPDAIFHSQLVRFYELHALLFFVGAVAVYRLTETPLERSQVLAPAMVAAFALLLALHLQILTAVGLAGLGVWAMITVGPRLIDRLAAHRHRVWIGGAVVVSVAALALLLVRSGAVSSAIRLFNYSDAWAADSRHNVRFYHWVLLEDYPTFWTLFPVIVLLAAARRARAAAFCAVIFGVAFVFHSLAAWKHMRYLQYAMPFYFALVGMGVAEVLPALHRRMQRVQRMLPRPFASRRWRSLLAAGGIAVTALFLFAGNSAFPMMLRMLAPSGSDADPVLAYRKSDWRPVALRLRALSDSAAVLVSSSDLKALYYLGRLDVILYRDHLYSDQGWAPEFGEFDKLGRPVISTPASVERLVSCYPTGLVIVEDGAWHAPWGVPTATAEYLETSLVRVPMPPQSRLKVFRWRTPAAKLTAPCSIVHPPARTVAVTSAR